MAFDPTKTALLLVTLQARADARQFTATQVVTTTLVRGNHPSQGAFPTNTNETRYKLTWSAVYRGQRLNGTTLVAPLNLLPLAVAASLQEASDAFDLTDTRLEALGANPNTYSPLYVAPAPIQVRSLSLVPFAMLPVSLSPASGTDTGGTLVMLIGAGFACATGVLFGSSPGLNFSVNTDGVILVTTPPGQAGAVDVTVVSVLGTQYNGVLKAGFTYYPPFGVASLVSPSGPWAATANGVVGTYFINGASLAVTIGGIACTNVVWNSSTSISFTSPAFAANGGPYDVVVTNGDGHATTLSASYTVLWAPSDSTKVLWLDANNATIGISGFLTGWNDQSGHGNNATASGAWTMQYGWSNGLNALAADTSAPSINSLLLASPAAKATVLLVGDNPTFAEGGATTGGAVIGMGTGPAINVGAYDFGLGYQLIYGDEVAADEWVNFNRSPYSGPQHFEWVLNGGGNILTHYIAGVQQTIQTGAPAHGPQNSSSSFAGTVTHIGNAPAGGLGSWNGGHIGELIVFDHVLSAAELTGAMAYSTTKWGLPLFTVNFTTFPVGGIVAGATAGSAFEVATGLRFTRASAATVQTSDHTIVSVSNDVACIGQPSTSPTLRGLSFKETRTNLITQNRNLTNAAWLGQADTFHATLTANYANGPDGNANATRVQKPGTPFYSSYQIPSAPSNGKYTWSSWNRTTNGTSFFASDYGTGLLGVGDQPVAVSPTWARFAYSDPTSYTSGQGLYTVPVWDTSLGQDNSAGDTLVDLVQLELGAFATDAIISGSSATTRAGEYLYHPNGAQLVNSAGRIRLNFEFVAMGAIGSAYSATQMLWYVDANNHVQIDTSGNVTATISGVTATFATPIACNAFDLVQVFPEVGGNLFSSLTIAVNGVEQTVQTAAPLGPLTVPGFLYLMCNSSGAQQLSSWIQKVQAYS